MATAAENKQFAKSILPIYPLDTAIGFIQENLEPEDVFNDSKLREWAIDNGFEEKEEGE